MDMLRRPELICFVSPLDNTNTSAIEVVPETKIQNLLGIIKSIEIKMIKRRSYPLWSSRLYFRARLAWILLEPAECRTINALDNTQTLSEPLRTRRLSR